MIKKLLSIGIFAFLSNSAVSQTSHLVTENVEAPIKHLPFIESNSTAKTAAIGTNDTLWYFYNKYYYRNATPTGFSAFKSPYQAAGVSFSGFASSFLSTNTVTVKGAYVLLSRQATSTSTAVPVKIYLYNVDATYKPTTKVDSGLAVVTGTAGAFVGALFTTPRVMTNYAIGFASGSTTTDTIKPYMNNASSSTTTVVVTPPALKYGESLSFIRYNGVWTSQTGFWNPAGSDKEFTVIPFVNVNLSAGSNQTTLPPNCVNTAVTYSNTSNSLFVNRQYNLNQFFISWPAAITPSLVPTTDPIFTTDFGDGTAPTNSFVTSKTYTAAGVFTGSLTGRYQLGVDNGQKVQDVYTSTITISPNSTVSATSSSSIICLGASVTLTGNTSASLFAWNTGATTLSVSVTPTTTTLYTFNAACSAGAASVTVVVNTCTGIEELTENQIRLFPNPSEGNVTIALNSASLSESFSVEIYDAIGKLVATHKLNTETNINISSLDGGVYLFKIKKNNTLIKTSQIIKL
jgi:hypothetical protein